MDTLVGSVILVLFTFTFLQFLRSLVARNFSIDGNNKYKFPPGPRPLPIIGNLLDIGRNPHHSLAKLANIHGPIMSLKMGQVTTVVISSAQMAKEVLLTHDQHLSNRSIPDSIYALDHKDYSMTFMPISPTWRGLKRICNDQLFASKALDAGQGLRHKKVQELVDDLRQCSLKGEAVEIERMAFTTAINLMSNALFSVDLVRNRSETAEFKELVAAIMKDGGAPNLADFFPILRMVDPHGIRRRMVGYISKVMAIFRCLIDERLKAKKGTNFDTMNDMLDTLLNISQDKTQMEMSKLQIEHLFLTLFVAGTDTITSTLEWAMTELLRSSNAMSKVKQELEQTIGIGNSVKVTDIARLPYLHAIIKETFRLHPPVPFLIPRKAQENVEIFGYTIPKNAQVFINVWAIGRDSGTWDNSNLFFPERFIGSQIDVKGRNFELTPFGSGRRMCPALPLAMRTLFLLLGSLLNSFDWKLEDGMKLDNINMDENFGITVEKAQSLRVIPIKINN